jgi:hypothetical protein
MKVRRILLVVFIALVFATNVYANPVEKAQCTPGGEYGNDVRITMDHKFEYGQLVIKRQNEGKDYTRNIETFKGGTYRLDLGSQGGITGYSVTYKNSGDEGYLTAEGTMTCAVSETTTSFNAAQDVTATPVVATPKVVKQEVEVTNTVKTVSVPVVQPETYVAPPVLEKETVTIPKTATTTITVPTVKPVEKVSVINTPIQDVEEENIVTPEEAVDEIPAVEEELHEDDAEGVDETLDADDVDF